MNAATATADDRPAPGTERRIRQVARLEELCEIGMDLARGIGQRGRVLADGAEAAALAMAFSRVSRAIRLTMALETRLVEGAPAPRSKAAPAAEAGARHVGLDPDADAEADEERFESLAGALGERLVEVEDEEDDLLDRPVGELVAQICRDLGVPYDAELWAEDDGPEPIRPLPRPGAPGRQAQHPRGAVRPTGRRVAPSAPLRPG